MSCRSTKKSRAAALRASKAAAASGKSGRPKWTCPVCGGNARKQRSTGERVCAVCYRTGKRGRPQVRQARSKTSSIASTRAN